MACSNLGARNFLFLNVPPIERSPLMQAQGASATTSEARVIADFNAKLAAAASAWGANHTGARTWLYDAHSAFGTILDSPTKYGFVDNTSYGGTGDFWGNNYHPSSAASVMFGQQVGSLLNGTVW
jgi:phospholipase/lecithinase/hemolysin